MALGGVLVGGALIVADAPVIGAVLVIGGGVYLIYESVSGGEKAICDAEKKLAPPKKKLEDLDKELKELEKDRQNRPK